MAKASKIIPLAVALLLITLALPLPLTNKAVLAQPSEVWVAPPPLGSNSNPGTEAQPFATIQWGIDHVDSEGTVHIAPGIYYENLMITEGTDLTGAGAQNTIIDGDGSGTVIAIATPSMTSNTISGFTIQNGVSSMPDGGGIYISMHIVTLINCVIKNNQAAVGGGGIFNQGFLLMYGCTVSGNSASELGGGIYNVMGGMISGLMVLVECTVSGNRTLSTEPSFGGAGIFHQGLIMELIDCTVANNTAAGSGGGFYNNGLVSIFFNTIVANNSAGTGNNGYSPDHEPISGGYNLDSENSCGFDQPTDLINTDPLLGPLQDNGGPTFTHALLHGSLAIDGGDCFFALPGAPLGGEETQSLLSAAAAESGMAMDTVNQFVEMTGKQFGMESDQRGVPRPQGTNCDIGAYELAQAAVATATGTGTASFSTLNGYISDLTALDESGTDCGSPPSALDFPFGLFSFTVTGITPGSTVTIVIILPSNAHTNTQYWKCINGQWVDATSILGSNDGDSVLTLTITDGGQFDADGQANGEIHDPGGPAVAVAVTPAPGVSPTLPRYLSQPQMSLQYLNVSPQQASANQPITITTNVVNTGDEAGNLNVALKINGQVEQSRMVSVGAHGTQPVKFTVTKAQPGTYTVDIGGQKGSFNVLGTGGTGTSPSNRMIAILIIGALVLAAALVVWLLIRRPA